MDLINSTLQVWPVINQGIVGSECVNLVPRLTGAIYFEYLKIIFLKIF
jgi:hypothetical protein